jgi:hypothetical protein
MGVEDPTGLGEGARLDLGDSRSLDAIAICGFAKKIGIFSLFFFI